MAEDGFLDSFDVSIVAQAAESTSRVAQELQSLGVGVVTYPQNIRSSGVDRIVRFIAPERKARNCKRSTALWSELRRRKKAIVWFILDGFYSIGLCETSIERCVETKTPFHVIVQHVPEMVHFENADVCDSRFKLYSSANRVIFVSQRNLEAAESGFGFRLKNSQVGINGLTKKTFDRFWKAGRASAPRTSGTASLINVARFSVDYKGQNLLISALGSGKFAEREWSCRFVGGGQDRWLIERLVNNCGSVRGRFQILDRHEAVDDLLLSSDLFLLPSYSEGMAFALVEAAAACRPLVATDVAGARELVISGSTGFLADAATAPSVANALERAFANRSEWPAMGIAAHDLARETCCLSRYLEKIKLHSLSDLN